MSAWSVAGLRVRTPAHSQTEISALDSDFLVELDPSARAEFSSLARERDPVMYAEGLLQFGQRLEAANHLASAARIFSALGEEGPSEIRRRARVRLDAMTGMGSSALRSEFLLRRVARETLEPTTLVGLTAASLAFRTARLSALSRLLGTPSANFLTRGFGAQTAAGLLGFGVEAAVFPLATRGAALAAGRDLDWSSRQIGRELASSFLLLGAMKLTGWAAGLGSASSLRQQAGMLAGIALGHRLESAAGLRPQGNGATVWSDALAMWFQFQAAGRLAQGIMGPGFHAWERELDGQARSLSYPQLPRAAAGPHRLFHSPEPAFASIYIGESARGREGSLVSNQVFMVGKGSSGEHPRIRVEGRRETRKIGGVIENSSDYVNSFHRLLEDPNVREHNGLKGVLANMIRGDGALRTQLYERLAADRDPAFVELNGRKGYLTKIMFFQGEGENLRPERVIFAHKVLRYDDNLDLMIFELEWLSGNGIRGNLYFPGAGDMPRLDSHDSGKIFSPQIAGPGLLQWRLFHRTSYEIFIEKNYVLNSVWEIRDPTRFLVLSLPQTFRL